MNMLKKINKGFILTIIVLTALIIYLVNVEIQRKDDKPAIKQACENYIEIISKYAVLPEEYQVVNKKLAKEDTEKYEKEFSDKLNEVMVENEKARELQKNSIKYYWGETRNATSVLTKFDKKINKFKSFEFDGDQVTVIFASETNKKIKYAYEDSEEQIKDESFKSHYDESITLKKENNTWKVIYADLELRSEYENKNTSDNMIEM